MDYKNDNTSIRKILKTTSEQQTNFTTFSINKFIYSGFLSFLALSPENCKPFSADRRGLNLGEGAAFVVLEPGSQAEARGVQGLCDLKGYANANDAFHQTASSPDGRGAYKAMSEAIRIAGISPREIDYINVHGTGTDNNDLTEGIAMERLFGTNVPDFSSTKTFTGHCLGAAGAIEAVFSVFSIMNDEIYPNLRYTSPVEGTHLVPATGLTKKNIRHVLSNSFGFGGCDTSLVFSGIA